MPENKQRNRIWSSFSRKNSLTRILWIVIAALSVICVAAFSIATRVGTDRMERVSELRESETIINNMAGNIRAELDTYEDISRLVMIQDDVVAYLRAEQVDAGLTNDGIYGVMEMLNSCTFIDSVFIIRNDGRYMCTGRAKYTVNSALTDMEQWPKEILSRRGGAVVLINGKNNVFRVDGQPLITIGRSIYDINTQKQIGLMLMNISVNLLHHLEKQQDGKNVAIFTVDGDCLAGNTELFKPLSDSSFDDGIIHKETKTGLFNKQMMSGSAVKDTPLIVICTTKADVMDVPIEIIAALVTALAAFLASALILGAFFTRNITNPINTLASEISRTKKSQWLEKIDVDMPDNEIGMLADEYNSMIEHHNELFNKLIENETEVQRAEMRVLQEQIKPHFLYNSLETISFLAIDENAPNVHAALEALGSFYRNFLSRGDREIPLKREIQIIRDYMVLQKLRYGDILNDEYDIDEKTLDCMIPKLILQPLVENSIYHGIRLKGECGVIRISSFLKDGEVHITVFDSGIGMPRERINSLLSRSNDKGSRQRENSLSGFGLNGTISRIRYFSGKNDCIEIRSEEGEFTEIEITVPYKPENRKEEKYV